MPHLILEYSNNLSPNIPQLLSDLHLAMVATGAVNLKGLKSRAVKADDYLVADGHPDYKFVHLTIHIREGRPFEIQQEMAERTMAVLETAFARERAEGYISLSNDIQQLLRETALTRHNIPAGGHPSKQSR